MKTSRANAMGEQCILFALLLCGIIQIACAFGAGTDLVRRGDATASVNPDHSTLLLAKR
jgi:hypothetical protein